MKANVDKCRIMGIKGKRVPGEVASPADTPTIRWGGPGGSPIKVVREYVYMVVKLSDTCEWAPEVKHAIARCESKSGELAGALRGRRVSGQLKRLLLLSVLRPSLEWGAAVWRHIPSLLPQLDGALARLLTRFFHCPHTVSHSALQELKVRPMSIWFD